MRKRERLWGVLQRFALSKYAKRTSSSHHPNPIVIMKEWMESIDSELPLASFSVIDALQKATGQQVTSYILDKNGHLRPATFADKGLIKVSEMLKAMDNGQLVYTIAQIMESLTKEIESIAKSEMAFYDNHEILNAILNDASSILHLHLNKTRFIMFSNSEH